MHLKDHQKFSVLDTVRKISGLANIHFVRQPEQLGLGHAVLMAKSFVGDEPFAVLLGDDIIHSDVPGIEQLIKVYDSDPMSIIGVREVPWDHVCSYGIVKGEHMERQSFHLLDVIEKPSRNEAPSNFAIVGRYVIQPSIFSIIESVSPGKNGEIQLTDALREQLNQEGLKAVKLDGTRYDIGDKLEYIKASIGLALHREDLKEPLLQYVESIMSIKGI